MKIEFEITDKSFELLKKIAEAGQAEFRDSNYESLEDYLSSDDETKSKERFDNRNFCDLKDLNELITYNLLDTHEMAWHLTFIVSDFGKEMLEKIKVKKLA
jgi:hypothetical protein